MNKYFIEVPLEYLMGHLRYGHYEGEIELTDEEYKKIISGNIDNELRDLIYGLDFVLDDYSVDDSCIDWNDISISKMEENKKLLIEIGIFEDKDTSIPPQHYGFYDSADEAIEALQELKNERCE